MAIGKITFDQLFSVDRASRGLSYDSKGNSFMVSENKPRFIYKQLMQAPGSDEGSWNPGFIFLDENSTGGWLGGLDPNSGSMEFVRGKRSLLIEPESINLIPNSRNPLSAASWSRSNMNVSSSGENFIISPTNPSSPSWIQSIVAVPVSKGVVSLEIKTSRLLSIGLYPQDSNLSSAFMSFDGNELVTQTTNVSNWSVEDTSDGWKRVSFIFSLSNLQKTPPNLRIDLAAGNQSVGVRNFQVEPGSIRTSYIITNGTVERRFADRISIKQNIGWYDTILRLSDESLSHLSDQPIFHGWFPNHKGSIRTIDGTEISKPERPKAVYDFKEHIFSSNFNLERSTSALDIGRVSAEFIPPNTPRYCTLSNKQGILVENERTNLLPRTNSFTDWNNSNISQIEGGMIGLNSNLKSTLIRSSAAFYTMMSPFTPIQPGSYFASIVVKNINSSTLRLLIYKNNVLTSASANLNWNTDGIDIGDGWKLFWHPFTITETDQAWDFRIAGYGTGTSSFLIWSAQVERGSSVSTPIFTDGSAATRGGDTIRIPLIQGTQSVRVRYSTLANPTTLTKIFDVTGQSGTWWDSSLQNSVIERVTLL